MKSAIKRFAGGQRDGRERGRAQGLAHRVEPARACQRAAGLLAQRVELVPEVRVVHWPCSSPSAENEPTEAPAGASSVSSMPSARRRSASSRSGVTVSINVTWRHSLVRRVLDPRDDARLLGRDLGREPHARADAVGLELVEVRVRATT